MYAVHDDTGGACGWRCKLKTPGASLRRGHVGNRQGCFNFLSLSEFPQIEGSRLTVSEHGNVKIKTNPHEGSKRFTGHGVTNGRQTSSEEIVIHSKSWE